MKWRRYVRVGSLALTMVISLSVAGPAYAAGEVDDNDPALFGAHPAAIEGSYIVVLRPAASTVAAADSMVARASDLGGVVTYRYTNVFDGFAAELPDVAVAELRRDPRVAYVEQDTMSYPAVVPQPATAPLQPDQTLPDGTWGLDRIDQRTLPLDNSYSYTSTGQGVTVYVIDTGIRETHQDFGGRAEGVLDLVEDGMGTHDCWNHGTPVAGMIGGSTYGVAKQVEIKAIRIFGCNTGSPSSRTIAAIDWVAENAVAPAVVNMSFNGPPSAAQDAAAAGLVEAGLVPVTSSGNNNRDACGFSPLHPDMLMVGGMELTQAGEQRRSISNFGPCVDVHAPGAALRGPSPENDTAVTELRNGTSYASPHVAGIVARLLEDSPNLSSAQVKAIVVGAATTGELDPVTLPTGTPNRISFLDPDD